MIKNIKAEDLDHATKWATSPTNPTFKDAVDKLGNYLYERYALRGYRLVNKEDMLTVAVKELGLSPIILRSALIVLIEERGFTETDRLITW